MYRYKLTQTHTGSANARQLQQVMLAYHDFRQCWQDHPLTDAVEALGRWQAQRLRRTHRDLYETSRYREALDFLLEDLYSPRDFTRRDDDVERIFPYLVKLLPDSALLTLAQLVELNLVSQRLDLMMGEWLTAQWGFSVRDIEHLSHEVYAAAYRACGHEEDRRRQIELVDAVGRDLERYVSNRSLRGALKMMGRPARMAGLEELYRFISEGVHAFRAMGGVDELLDTVTVRERWIMNEILAGNALPASLPEHLVGKPD